MEEPEILNNKTGKKTVCVVLILIILCTALVSVIGGMRTRLHIDEVWTFGLSNNNGSPFYYDYVYGVGDSILQSAEEFDYHNEQEYKDYFYHWHTSDYYREYLTVQEDERFDYSNVFQNQTEDTHPPLYYCVIHTICSLFPNEFSFWFGLIPNLLFYAISLFFLFLISKELLKSDLLAVLSMLLWGLSRAGVTEAIFIRMYMMETCLTLALIYTNIKLLHKYRWWLVGLTGLIEVAGFLTHYYFYIVAFFLTAFTCLHYLLEKQYKKMLAYGLTGLFAVGVAMAIFPATIRHLTQGTWSGSTGSNLLKCFDLISGISKLLNQVISYYFGIDLNFYVFVIVILISLLGGLAFFAVKKYKEESNIVTSGNLIVKGWFVKIRSSIMVKADFIRTHYLTEEIITLTVLFSSFVIVGLEPDMGEYIIRYLFVVLPLFSVLIIYALKKVFEKIYHKNQNRRKILISLSLCVVALILSSNLLQEQVLLKLNQNGAEVKFDGEKVIVANYISNKDHAFAYLYLDAEEVYPIDKIDERFMDVLEGLTPGESVIVVVQSELASQASVEKIFSNVQGLSFEYLSTSCYPLEINSLYYVYRIVSG